MSDSEFQIKYKMNKDEFEEFVERVATGMYDGGLSEVKAQQQALLQILEDRKKGK